MKKKNRVIKRMAVFGVLVGASAILSMTTKIEAKVKTIAFTDGKSIVMGVNESKTLKVTITPKKSKKAKLTYKCSNKAVASISAKGVLVGKQAGQVTITVTAKDGSKKSATMKVQVINKVESIKLLSNLKGKLIYTNQRFQINAAVLPSKATIKAIQWVSSDATIAAVTATGVVTTKKKGTVTIYAKSMDGTKKQSGQTIQVVQPITSISLSVSTNPVYQVQRTVATPMTATIVPSFASNKNLTWSSDDRSIATISTTGVVTGLTNGKVVIRAKSNDGSGVTKAVTVEVVSIAVNEGRMIAHRGFSSQYPENTVEAFEQAAKAGFWGIECDVWKTMDGEFAITHNKSLLKMYGFDEDVTEVTFAQARSYPNVGGVNAEKYSKNYTKIRIPTLEEYIQVVSANKGKNLQGIIELKMPFDDDSLDKMVAIIDKYSVRDNVKFISQYKDNLTVLNNKYPDLKLEYLVLDTVPTTAELNYCIANQIDLGCLYSKITKAQIDLLHNAGIDVGVFTVDNFYTAYDYLNNYGVDSITTDCALFDSQSVTN